MRTCFRMFVAFVLLSALVPTAAWAQGELTREKVAEWLRYQEGLVRSAYAVFEISCRATPPEAIPLIQEACHNRGQPDRSAGYVVTDAFVAKNNLLSRWWRKGAAERSERLPFGDGGAADNAKPLLTTVFDGHTVRSLANSGGGFAGAVENVDGSHWYSANRQQPFSLTYEWYGRPYSSAVSEAVEFAASSVVRDGQTYSEVRLRANEGDWLTVVLLLDSNHRIVERQVFGKLPSEPTARLYEKVILSDYQQSKDDSGETIWFPRQAVYHFYCGTLADGTPVEYTSQTMHIREMDFNVDIPDSTFLLTFPPGTKLYDGLSGLGWLDKSEVVARLSDETIDNMLRQTPSADETFPAAGTNDPVRPASAFPRKSGPVAAEDERWDSRWVALVIAGAVALVATVLLYLRARSRLRQSRNDV